MSNSVKIIVPGIPPSLNQTAGRKNVWRYREEKALWTKLVKSLCPKQAKPFDKADVTLTYYFPTRQRRDPDNYSGKPLLDGLTQAGIIVDDSFKHITLHLDGGYDKTHPRVEIEVEEK